MVFASAGEAMTRASRDGRVTAERYRRSGGGTEKVTVNLTSSSAAALDRLVVITGESKTNVINRAVKVLAYIQEQLDAGGVLYIRDIDTNEAERLRIF